MDSVCEKYMKEAKWKKQNGSQANRYYCLYDIDGFLWNYHINCQAYTKFTDTSQLYDNIVANLKQVLIVDIQSKQDQNCESNYTSLFNWNWGGMNDGCDCTYASTTEIAKTMYRGPSNIKINVCVKRGLSKYAYYKVAYQQKGAQCVGQKLCGNLVYPKSVFCVAQDDPCPIYDIQVSFAQFDPNYTGYQKVSLPNGNYLYYDNLGSNANAVKEPLSVLRLTQDAGVCHIKFTQKNIPVAQYEYVLSISSRSSCSQFDPTFIQNGLSMKGFIDASNSLTDLKKTQLVVMIINIIVCLMVSIILQVSKVYSLMGKDVPCFEGSRDEEQAKIKKTKSILSYGGKLLQIPFLLWAFIVSAQKKEDQVYKKNLSALIVLGITLFIDVVLLLKIWCCAKKTPNPQEEPANPNLGEEQKPVNQNQYLGQPQPQYNNIQMQNMQPGVGPAQFQGTYQDLPNYGYPVAQPVIQQPGYIYQPIQQPVYPQPVYPQQAYPQPQPGYQQQPYAQPLQQEQPYTYPVQQQQQYAYPIQEQQVYAQIQDQQQQLQPVKHVQPIQCQKEGFIQPTEQRQNY
ncbi:hypothetical protein ABPG72_003419 [Tetrahymena utriculariae]